MIGFLQRVRRAEIRVDEQVIAEIGVGLMILVGVRDGDHRGSAERLVERLLAYRVFADDAGRMNLSLTDTGGELMLVPQFTLAAETDRGNRPGFSRAAPRELARELYEHAVASARAHHPSVAEGRFGADMQIALVNDGPVSFWLEASS